MSLAFVTIDPAGMAATLKSHTHMQELCGEKGGWGGWGGHAFTFPPQQAVGRADRQRPNYPCCVEHEISK